MTKKHVAVIGLKGLPAFGGAATVGENLINELQNTYKFTVYSISSHTDNSTNYYKDIYQIVFKKIPLKRINTLYYYFLAVFHALIIGKYDLVHLHHSDSAFLIPLLRLKYKVIVTTHGVHNSGMLEKWKNFRWFFQGQVKYFLKFANIITCVSKIEKEWLLEKYGLKATFIPNGVNVFHGRPDSDVLGADIFFGAGRIIKSKGCALLLKALHEINFQGKIQIAGNLENQSQQFKSYILELSDGLNVELLGLIKNKQELLNYIYKSSLFVFPSRKEAMSMMLLEAASTGVPIVCSDIRENMDIFNAGDVIFFKSGDYVDLAKKIMWAIHNTNKAREKATHALDKSHNLYECSKIGESYKLLYEECL